MSIGAVLISHNSQGTILKSLRALLEQDEAWDEIIVVDNASTDGSPQQIQQAFPSVRVILLTENKGISAARNHGLGLLTSDLAILVDDDVYLSPGSLKRMIDAQQEIQAAVVCPRIVLQPETDTLQCDGAEIHFTGMFSLRRAYQTLTQHAPARTFTRGFIGACLLVDRKRLNARGNFDEDYFFYFEDMELSYRLSALGETICCEENALVYHERGKGTENLSFRGNGLYPKRRAYFTLRNRWLTILIHYQARTLVLLSPALGLYEAAAFLESVRRGWLAEYIRSVFSLIVKAPSIVRRRQRQQSQRSIRDRDILTGGDLPFARGFADEKRSRYIRLLNQALCWYWDRVRPWL